MHQFQITPIGEGEPYTIEAATATFDETSGAVSFHDEGDPPNLVARLLNVSFYQLPAEEPAP